MVIHMKTTLNLDGELLRRAKQRAVETSTTLTAVVESALRNALAASTPRAPYRLEMPTVDGAGPPAVDPADRAALYDRMVARE